MQKEIIYALSGLAGAVANNGKTGTTDNVLRNALVLAGDDQLDEAEKKNVIDAIHNEKFRVSPGCATCGNPCGNTSDYEDAAFSSEPEPIQNSKLKMMEESILWCTRHFDDNKEIPEEIYRSLTIFRYNLDASAYRNLEQKIQSL